MKYGKIVGRIFCTRQDEGLTGKKLLLIQPLDWEKGEERGDPIVAADACGSGASEFIYWVASREAAVAFPEVPPIDAAAIGIVEGHQVDDFRKRAGLR
jgi:ethanolamine utilization protein EutN